MPKDDSPIISAAVEHLAELIREEVPGLLTGGHGWKLILHGSGGGDAHSIIEVYEPQIKRLQIVGRTK